jgi:hypothetical protein
LRVIFEDIEIPQFIAYIQPNLAENNKLQKDKSYFAKSVINHGVAYNSGGIEFTLR